MKMLRAGIEGWMTRHNSQKDKKEYRVSNDYFYQCNSDALDSTLLQPQKAQ